MTEYQSHSKQTNPRAPRTMRARSNPGASPRQRRSGRLASTRDQERLQERVRQERERVERMFATLPSPVGPDSHSSAPSSPSAPSAPSARNAGQNAGRRPGQLYSRAPMGVPRPADSEPLVALRSAEGPMCRVCGGSQIVSDEVQHAGTLRLLECLRCENRWTERGVTMQRRWRPRPGPIRVVDPRVPETPALGTQESSLGA